MSWKSDYDYPMSHGCYRALCVLHGETPPPNVDYDPSTKTQEEHDADYDRWQNEQQLLGFGYSADGRTTTDGTKIREIPAKTYPLTQAVPRSAAVPVREGLKGIEIGKIKE